MLLATATTTLADYAAGAPIIDRIAYYNAEFRSALSNVRGEPEGNVRQVQLAHYGRSLPGNLDVRGPRDGRPLLIDSVRGFYTLNVLSGNVVIHADSASGNPIDVHDGANVTVLVTRDRKISVTVHDGGRAHIVITDGATPHGYQHAETSNASLDITGNTERLTIRRADEATR